MTEENWDDHNLAFEIALRKLREDFPEFYVEAWGPWDYCVGFNNDEFHSHDELEAQIMDDIDMWPNVVEILHDTFDANYGTNWDRLRSAVIEARRTVQELKNNASK